MNTDAINIKLDPETKQEAQALAKDMGFSLSTLVKAYLKHFVKTKTVHFSAIREEPNAWAQHELEQSAADYKAGRYVEFTNPEDALRHIDQMIVADEAKSTDTSR